MPVAVWFFHSAVWRFQIAIRHSLFISNGNEFKKYAIIIAYNSIKNTPDAKWFYSIFLIIISQIEMVGITNLRFVRIYSTMPQELKKNIIFAY